eukprot:scaffold14958_cov79-Phaeocystis_antarctica.AAC.11
MRRAPRARRRPPRPNRSKSPYLWPAGACRTPPQPIAAPSAEVGERAPLRAAPTSLLRGSCRHPGPVRGWWRLRDGGVGWRARQHVST